MKKHWLNILVYGLALGLLLASMQFFRYKWVLVSHSTDWYFGLVALLFTALGIWAGLSLTQKKTPSTPVSDVVSANNAAEIAQRLGITPRELAVLQLVAKGHSNQEIANHLFVSLNTVKTHISNVFSKLDAERRTQAIQKAQQLGLLE